MSRSLHRITAVLLVSALLAACATSPTGRRQLMLVSEDSAIASSAQAYVQEVGKLKKEGKLSSDKALIQRVNSITERLVAQAILMRPDSADWAWSVAVGRCSRACPLRFTPVTCCRSRAPMAPARPA